MMRLRLGLSSSRLLTVPFKYYSQELDNEMRVRLSVSLQLFIHNQYPY